MAADDMRERLAAILDADARHELDRDAVDVLLDAGWSDEHAAEVARLTERADALQARIDAVQLASATPEDVESVEWAAGQDARLLSLYRRALDRIDTALTDEQPAATPETPTDVRGNRLAENDDERCRIALGPPGDDSARCERLAMPRHGTHLVGGVYHIVQNAVELNEALDAETPEPPHLDPLPWVCTAPDFERYADRGDYEGTHAVVFAPRPADKHGRPYSQRREDYEGER